MFPRGAGRRVIGGVMPLFMKYLSKLVNATLLVVAVLLLFPNPSHGQRRRWRSFQHRRVISFDWNCARTASFPPATLTKIVHRSIDPEDRSRAWGDRAFTFSLQRGGPTAYFVPTVCSATGNCAWRIYTVRPVRYLGEISGQFIYTYSSHGWPIIVTYTRMGSAEGILSTYVPHRGRYRWVGDEYPIGQELKLEGVRGLRANGYRMPAFFERAIRQCKEYGG